MLRQDTDIISTVYPSECRRHGEMKGSIMNATSTNKPHSAKATCGGKATPEIKQSYQSHTNQRTKSMHVRKTHVDSASHRPPARGQRKVFTQSPSDDSSQLTPSTQCPAQCSCSFATSTALSFRLV
jgi:hypothetical protein